MGCHTGCPGDRTELAYPFTLQQAGLAWAWAPTLPGTPLKPVTSSGRPKSSDPGPCSGSLGVPHRSIQKLGTEHGLTPPLPTCARARQLVQKHRLGAGLRTSETQSFLW